LNGEDAGVNPIGTLDVHGVSFLNKQKAQDHFRDLGLWVNNLWPN
jgi:hypothetical protein